MRRAAVTGVVLLVLVGGFLLLERRSARSHRATPSEGATEPVASVEEPTAEEDEAEDGEEGVQTVEVRGTVVVVDHDGRHVTGESGTFQLHVDFYHVNVDVSDGRWHADVPAGAKVSFEEVLLGGRKAIADPAEIDIPATGVVEVRCRWFVPARLRVVGEKGEDLDGVELAERESDEIVPVDGAEVIDAGPSPVAVPAEDHGVARYWVRARSHAWTRVSVWQGDAGERVVRLVRAGAVEARLVPFDAESEVVLHVWRGGEYVLGWTPDESGLCRIEGLPPGRLELRAATGWVWNERVYAVAEVEVEPGRTAQATLSVQGVPATPEPVPVEGTLHVDPAWPEPEAGGFCGLGSRTLRIAVDGGTGPMVELNHEDGRWSVKLVPGPHCFTVSPFMWTQVIEVGPNGHHGARLVVPPPCDVEVQLVDAATRAAVPEEDDLWWYVTSGHIDWPLIDFESQPCSEPGVWRFQAPVGTIVVSLWNVLRDAPATEVELKPGRNRIELQAVPNFSCELAILDGKNPVPVDEDAAAGVRADALDGDGGLEECGAGYPCTVWFKRAGRYRIALPEIEGYEPVAPFEVEIAAGKRPRIEIPLKRR